MNEKSDAGRIRAIAAVCIAATVLSCTENNPVNVNPESVTITAENLVYAPGFSQGAVGAIIDFCINTKWQIPDFPVTVWDFGDGSEPVRLDGFKSAHEFAKPGKYTVKANLKDRKNGEIYAYASMTFEIIDDGPLIFHKYKSVTTEPLRKWVFAASCSKYLTNRDTVYYNWEFGDGSWSGNTRGTKEGHTQSHAYKAPGTYTLIVTASTWDRTLASDTCTVHIGEYTCPAMATAIEIHFWNAKFIHIDSLYQNGQDFVSMDEYSYFDESMKKAFGPYEEALFPWMDSQSFACMFSNPLDLKQSEAATVRLSADGKLIEYLCIDKRHDRRTSMGRFERFMIELENIPLETDERHTSDNAWYGLQGTAISGRIRTFISEDVYNKTDGLVRTRRLAGWEFSESSRIRIAFNRY